MSEGRQSTSIEQNLQKVAAALVRARRVLILTGAGMSADSGLPTYRGLGGLYAELDAQDDLPIEVRLSGAMMRRDRRVTWKLIAALEEACRGAKPHVGHKILKSWETRIESLTVITQNVDGLHQAAGSRNVIPLHGQLHTLLCEQCGASFEVENYAALNIPPDCKLCSGPVRPAVVLFGEMLPHDAVKAYQEALAQQPDVILSIGTTNSFPYTQEPLHQGTARGAFTVELNPDRTEVSASVAVKLPLGAADGLSRLDSLYREHGFASNPEAGGV